MDTVPELLFSRSADQALSRRVRRLAASGRLRKLYAGVYTSDLQAPAEWVVLRHWHAIVGHLLPGGVISYRSAFDGRPHAGKLHVTRGKTRRTLQLPGLTVEIVPGPPAVTDGAARDVPYGSLFLASEPRRFLENLGRGRGWLERALPQQDIEVQLDKMLALRGEHRLNDLRDACRALAPTLHMAAEFARMDGIVGALLGTHTARNLSARQSLARAAGRPYDPARIERFDTLFSVLNREVFPAVADPAPAGAARENFGFFESYFSNYIEGTTFTVAEAESIVFEGRIIENRNADSHDIIGSFAAATRSPWRDQPATEADGFLAWLKSVHAQVMQQRPDKKPGEWKDQVNQAGSTIFVLPELVPGTLREAFERIQALTDPLARALMTMFVISEVHPFIDGNGRTARLAMNAVLSEAGLSRIIVPTVCREDYLLPLKALSHNADAKPFVSTMARLQAWSAAFDFGAPRQQLRARLAACHAFEEDLARYRLVFPERADAPDR
jgi:fido (protein-threonine AMPylation protein)